MHGSVHALLAGAIDYAGTYPPAALPFSSALESLRRYRAAAEAWLLGQFVCPATLLPELEAAYQPERDGRLAVIVPAADSADRFLKNVDDALTRAAHLPAAGAVASLEFRWPDEALLWRDRGGISNLLQAVSGQVATSRLAPLTMYFEIPPAASDVPEAARRELLATCLAAIAGHNASAVKARYPAGFKVRTGGTTAGAVPSPAELAAVIAACRDRGVFWKATAGLHRALRRFDAALSTKTHGFLNVISAAVLAELHRLDEAAIQTILDEEDARAFRFDGTSLTCRDLSATPPQIETARQQSLRSFGSCSFEEPCADLRNMGFL